MITVHCASSNARRLTFIDLRSTFTYSYGLYKDINGLLGLCLCDVYKQSIGFINNRMLWSCETGLEYKKKN
jgi:hypothetical protein